MYERPNLKAPALQPWRFIACHNVWNSSPNMLIYMLGIMYRTAVIMGKISPDRTKWVWFTMKGFTYFPDNDCRSIHYPAYYMVTCQHTKNLIQGVFYNLCVTVQSVFQQRNIVCQTDAVLLLPLRCFPLFFFSWPVTTTQPFTKSWNHRNFQKY